MQKLETRESAYGTWEFKVCLTEKFSVHRLHADELPGAEMDWSSDMKLSGRGLALFESMMMKLLDLIYRSLVSAFFHPSLPRACHDSLDAMLAYVTCGAKRKNLTTKFSPRQLLCHGRVPHCCRESGLYRVTFAVKPLFTGNAEDYKRARYDLRRSIRQAKRQYRVKLEGCYTSADSRRMWQGLRHITDYQQRSREVTTSHTTLPDQLNEFYARFEALNPDRQRGVMAEGSTQNSSLTVTSVEVCKALRRINPRKAAGPDNIPGRALKVCSSELAGVLVDIFNLSLAQSSVPSCFKTTTIGPLPKKSVVTCLNDYRPVALTPIVMKCFERIIMSHIQETIPDTRSATVCVPSEPSAFNTVIPTKLAGKAPHPRTDKTHPLQRVLNFLTDRPPVRSELAARTSSTRTVSTGTPQGCVLSPLLYTRFTYDCVASQSNTSIIKFADDTVIGLITGGDETAYRREVAELVD
ncbi:hypothetical protein NFI96_005396 [Prochilodus magdalenae]|nr:hypothetical protein NFI96_005396 [Prochilodus magdalenae]